MSWLVMRSVLGDEFARLVFWLWIFGQAFWLFVIRHRAKELVQQFLLFFFCDVIEHQS